MKPSLPSVPTPQPELSAKLLHDLRTPLNHIIGFSEMLTEQAEEEGQIGFLPDLQQIQAAAQQLLALLGQDLPAISSQDETPQDSVLQVNSVNALDAASTTVINSSTSALILVVDDIKANRDLLSRRLIQQGYEVAMAENGREAIEMVRAQAFDLVLLDIMMPEIDGYEVLQTLKADEVLRHIPVIMISALHEMDSVVRCITMGAQDYLTKPFDPVLLKARIGACLDTKRSHDREMQLFEQLQQNFKLLQQSEKERNDLSNMIVHDLRTPLTSVMVGMQTVEMVGELNDEQREMMSISMTGGETLLGMINDLLDVEKMESGTMELEISDIKALELLNGAIVQVASLAEAKNLRLEEHVAPEVPLFQGDAGKLTRTLVNLIGNAIKFTPRGGIIKVEARRSQDEDFALFSVSDNGEGIPEESFERIFEKFGQVASRKAGRIMSTGLGLAFCKLAVEAHKGNITVESIQDQGTTFRFSVPIAAG